MLFCRNNISTIHRAKAYVSQDENCRKFSFSVPNKRDTYSGIQRKDQKKKIKQSASGKIPELNLDLAEHNYEILIQWLKQKSRIEFKKKRKINKVCSWIEQKSSPIKNSVSNLKYSQLVTIFRKSLVSTLKMSRQKLKKGIVKNVWFYFATTLNKLRFSIFFFIVCVCLFFSFRWLFTYINMNRVSMWARIEFRHLKQKIYFPFLFTSPTWIYTKYAFHEVSN